MADPENARMEICGKDDCFNRAVLTTRIRTDRGPTFHNFCLEHLRDASEMIRMICEGPGSVPDPMSPEMPKGEEVTRVSLALCRLEGKRRGSFTFRVGQEVQDAGYDWLERNLWDKFSRELVIELLRGYEVGISKELADLGMEGKDKEV